MDDTNSSTIWKGVRVELRWPDHPCAHPDERVGVLHHYGDDGKHYCPTGFIMCYECGATGDEPEPYTCRLYDEGYW